jgi:exodeoxyribonuclease-3
LKIINSNVNGIRSATTKGFWEWFAAQNADILCLQELKAQDGQIPPEALPDGYSHYFHFAEKSGYSGVALYSRRKPDTVHIGLGSLDKASKWHDMDAEGRFIMADFGKISVASVYFCKNELSGTLPATDEAAQGRRAGTYYMR